MSLNFFQFIINSYKKFQEKRPVVNLDHIIFFDVESSGPDPFSDELIEVAAVVYDKTGTEIDSFDSLIKKPKGFVNKTKHINNIEESDLIKLSSKHDLDLVLSRLTDFFSKYGDCAIVAHNAEFDLLFLRNALINSNIKYGNFLFKDSLEIFRSTFRAKSYALDKLRFEFGIIGDSHRAKVDCIDLATLFFKFLKKNKIEIISYLNLSYTRNLKFNLFDHLYYFAKKMKSKYSCRFFKIGKEVKFQYKGKLVKGRVNRVTSRLVELKINDRDLIYLFDKIEKYY